MVDRALKLVDRMINFVNRRSELVDSPAHFDDREYKFIVGIENLIDWLFN